MGFFNISSLNPLSYISNSIMNGVISTILLMMYTILATVVSVFSYILNSFLTSMNGMINELLIVSEPLGPFGIPLFTIGIMVLFSSLIVFFKFVHNLPVVGDFV